MSSILEKKKRMKMRDRSARGHLGCPCTEWRMAARAHLFSSWFFCMHRRHWNRNRNRPLNLILFKARVAAFTKHPNAETPERVKKDESTFCLPRPADRRETHRPFLLIIYRFPLSTSTVLCFLLYHGSSTINIAGSRMLLFSFLIIFFIWWSLNIVRNIRISDRIRP